jgi:hypothetical protein
MNDSSIYLFYHYKLTVSVTYLASNIRDTYLYNDGLYITSQITHLCSAEICKNKQRLRMLYDITSYIHILLIINFENFNGT